MFADTRRAEGIATWPAHNGEVYGSAFSMDEASCYSMGSDGKVRYQKTNTYLLFPLTIGIWVDLMLQNCQLYVHMYVLENIACNKDSPRYWTLVFDQPVQ